ncbi:MAG: CCA tRNA nucleotidyltransferase [Nanoarchaeota archaeon]|nr:CCA tRNA nucleotidyltransferase [Nanoarchaeota archaeon]
MMSVLSKVIKKIKPAKQEFKVVDSLIKQINALLKKKKIKAVCVAGGSYAKGTILKNDFDVDLFVRFDYKMYKKKDISKLLEKAIAPLKPEMVHGSRDYYQLRKNKILFEFVPVLNIQDYKQAVNVTDMSPLHVDYVKKHMSLRLADEVRLAKQFCKATNVYGAESYIRGFSGHVLDLFIIYYGSFENLLMQASVWGERVILDPAAHLKDPLRELNKSKTESPLIIVDPIQPDRNAAAAVSREKFELFKQKARAFLHKPSEKFFEIKKLNAGELKKKAGKNWLVLLKVKPLKGKDDVVGTKILKCFEHIGTHLKKHEFNALESGWEFDQKQSLIYFIINKVKMSDKIVLRGPPVKAKIDAKRFKAKHKKVFEKNKNLYAEEKREYKTPEALIKNLIKEDYVKSRVKKIEL